MPSSSASAGAGAGASSSASLILSPTERTAFGFLFSLACPPDSGGILTADSAVAFFGKSALPPTTLGAIWALADDKNNGFLDAKGFSIACRLIGHAQAGAPVDFRAAATPAPIPVMEGITIPGLPPAAAAATPAPAPPAPDAAPVTITPADRARFTRIFASAGPSNGLLDSDQAKDLFVKSNLPVDKLAAIWGLADTHQRGALDLTDFIIAMHFIQNTMNGTLHAIPAALPPGLYESASVGAPKPVGAVQPGSPMKTIRQQSTGGSFTSPSSVAPIRHQTTGSGAGPFAGTPIPSAIPRQLTGQQYQTPNQGSRVGSPAPAASAFRSPSAQHSQLAAGPASPFGFPQAQQQQQQQLPTAASVIAAGSAVSPPWAVPAATIQRAATFFTQLDTANTGMLNGASVVPFFMQSQLPEAALAQIWDLADVHQRGTLGLEEFSLAMHFIGESMAGKPLPTLGPGQSLPRELLPPSARGADLPQPVPQGESDTQKDLFSLMDDDDDTTSGALKAAATLPPALKNATASTFVNPTASPPPSAMRQSSIQTQNQTQAQRNFNGFDDDFFNGPQPGSAPAPAPGSTVKSVRIAEKPPSIISSPDTVTSTLPPTSPPPGPSANLSAVQADSLRKDIDTQSTRQAALGAEASALEGSIATDASSLSELEARLKTARASSDAEQARVASLRERAAAQSGELASLRAELISVESALSALKMERDEVEQALMKEREDVRGVRKRMEELRVQSEGLRGLVDGLRKEARREKGLGAITRKQLVSAEKEKEKVEVELEGLRAGELGEDDDDETDAPVERTAALSPTDSVRSNNPFDRLTIPAAASSTTERSAEQVHSPSADNDTATAAAAGSSSSSSVGVLGLAAGAGAALAGIASAARAAVGLESGGEDSSPTATTVDEVRGASEQLEGGDERAETPKQDVSGASAQSAFDDAFGDSEPTTATAAAPTSASGSALASVPESGHSAAPSEQAKDAFSSAFDDDFGMEESVGAGVGAGGGHAASGSTAFDDAFSGFDTPEPASAAATAHVAATDSSVEETTGSHLAPAPAAAAVPAISEPEEDHTIRQGAAADSRPSQDDDDDEDSSDEEDDGPEDLDVPGSGTNARSSPFEEQPSTTTSSEYPALTTTTSSDESATPFGSGDRAPAAGGLTTTDEPFGAVSTSTLDAPGPLRRVASQMTGSDTFHDANTATPLSGGQSPVDKSVGLPGDDDEEEEEAPAAAVSRPARRAPPPAPTKAMSGGGSSFAALGSGSGASGAAPGASSNNAFDDFEAAFEDLGPTGSAVPVPATAAAAAASGAANPTPTVDLDDAFDNDFDFVPSFSGAGADGTGANASTMVPQDAFDDAFGGPSSSSSAAAAAAAAPAVVGIPPSSSSSVAPLSDFNAAFDDFDASFGSPRPGVTSLSQQTGAAGTISGLGAGAGAGSGATGSGSGSGTGTNVSAPSSGFSFEDAFEPAGDSVLSSAPPVPQASGTTSSNIVGGVPPSLPPRRSSTDQLAVGGPTTAGAGAGQPSPALPDDAPPVQQLCAMGFSREKSIIALEKSNYRVEKALQRLLAG